MTFGLPIREVLHLDAMTVTGKTLGENLRELRETGFYDRVRRGLPTKTPCCTTKCRKATRYLSGTKAR